MSRLGKMPVELPDGVEASINPVSVSIKGPKGSLSVELGHGVEVKEIDKSLVVSVRSSTKQARANFGTTRSLLQNMVTGVTTGWKKRLLLSGVGFNAKHNGNKLVLAVGFSHDVELVIPEEVNVLSAGTSIEMESVDKDAVGRFAAKIRKVQPPEPYLGKGIRYDDEIVRRKAGKSGK